MAGRRWRRAGRLCVRVGFHWGRPLCDRERGGRALPRDLAAGLAIAFAGLYALTPLKRAGQGRCLEMCRQLTLPAGGAVRAAVVAGSAYGLSCVACSAGVMVALFAIGMSDMRVMVVAAALVFLFKLATPWARRVELVVAVMLVLAGGWYVLGQASAQLARTA
jgi:predicted metal-binding membrane protein